ncbi:hypothetical protein PM082_021957 [Marasmius tenuissimus]|nr:hypothetical protein PM082_021957 [Marasmius tenuissimus]
MKGMATFSEEDRWKQLSYGPSQLTSNSDLPPGYEGGHFNFIEMGCYVKLNGLVFVGFSGQRFLGSTPPLAQPSVEQEGDIPTWAYRWVHILYPQAPVLEGTATFNIAVAMGDNKPPVVQLTSDMKDLTET